MNHCKGLFFIFLMVIGAQAHSADTSAQMPTPQFPFHVVPSKDRLEFYPCSACHEYMEVNATPRILEEAPHLSEVRHGRAEIWCATCHDLNNKDNLHTLSGRPVDFNQSYLVCAQCHSRTFEDWQYGAHGKRVKRWRGGREIDNCTHCHNPHSDPGFAPRQPLPPPGVRRGMQHQPRMRHRQCQQWKPCPHNQSEDAHETK